MTKTEWIKVIKTYFKEVTSFENLMVIQDEDFTARFPIPPNSKVFSTEWSNGTDDINVITKDIDSCNSSAHYNGRFLIIQQEIDACIIVSKYGVSFIPWSELTVIGTSFNHRSPK